MADRHAYTSAAALEGKVNLLFAGVAAATALAAVLALRQADVQGTMGAVVDLLVSPSVLAVYEGLRRLYRRWGWRQSVGPYRATSVPDFSGTWIGTVQVMTAPASGVGPAGFEEKKPVLCTLSINQTLDEISIRLFTAETQSHSLTAHASQDSAGISTLRYTYHACGRSPDSRFPEHDGVAVLDLHRPPLRLRPNEGGWRERLKWWWRSGDRPAHRHATAKFFTSPPDAHAGVVSVTWICAEVTTLDAIDIGTLPADVQSLLHRRYPAALPPAAPAQ